MKKATSTTKRNAPERKRLSARGLRTAEFDPTLLGMMLELSVEERLEWLCSNLRAIQELQRGLRA